MLKNNSFQFLFIALIGFVAAAPVDSEIQKKEVQILRSERQNEEDGSYNFLYETDDGSFREEKGVIIPSAHADDEGEEKKVAITGSYKFIDDDGKVNEVHYTADEFGFVPYGDSIPIAITNAARAAHDEKQANH